jgi:hypothetical protein
LHSTQQSVNTIAKRLRRNSCIDSAITVSRECSAFAFRTFFHSESRSYRIGMLMTKASKKPAAKKPAAKKPAASPLLTAEEKKLVSRLKASAEFRRYNRSIQKSKLESLHSAIASKRRMMAAWERLESGRFAGALLPGGAPKDGENLDVAFDNVTIPDEYLVSLARHDGEKRGRTRGVADGLRLLSLFESIVLYAPEIDRTPDVTMDKLISDRKKLVRRQQEEPFSDVIEMWPFAVGDNGRHLVLAPADETFESRVIEFRADGGIEVIADSFVEWLESLAI